MHIISIISFGKIELSRIYKSVIIDNQLIVTYPARKLPAGGARHNLMLQKLDNNTKIVTLRH